MPASAPTAALLFLDFESSGLLSDEPPPTLYEASWTLTDQSGTQLTPLRTRLLGFDARGSTRGICVPELHSTANGALYAIFTETEHYPLQAMYPNQTVREMHEDSGLALEWATAAEQDPHAILRDPVEFDRSILDDLRSVGVKDLPPRALRLAGSGVARYEAEILPYVAPRSMDPTVWPWHYRPADLSIELANGKLRGSDLPTDIDAIIEHGLSTARKGGEEWRQILTDEGVKDIETFDVPHRADSDVARALATWRLLALDHR